MISEGLLSPKQPLVSTSWDSENGTQETLRIYSITSISGALLTRLVGDIMEFQDHGIPEK